MLFLIVALAVLGIAGTLDKDYTCSLDGVICT